jgi:alanine racemase
VPVEQGIVLTNSWVELSYPALERNVGNLKRAAGDRKLIAVIKSNAYGHGLNLVAKACQKLEQVDWVATAGEEEALQAYRAGVRKPILVLSYYNPASDILRHIPKLRLPLYSKEQAKVLSRRRLNIPLHLKINTGTSRLGLKPDQVLQFCTWLKRTCPNLSIEGVWSHFARAEEENWSTTKLQQQRLHQAVAAVRAAGYKPKHIHIDCSAPSIRRPTMGTTMVRVGLSLYGLWPSEATKKHAPRGMALEPILTWKTSVVSLQSLKPGESVGYGHSFTAAKPTKLATLPIGYFEGYRRAYAGSHVLIQGKLCPIRGRICMNLMMVDVTKLSRVAVGDKVVLIGQQGKAKISAQDLAEAGKTIDYEVVAAINPLLARAWSQ